MKLKTLFAIALLHSTFLLNTFAPPKALHDSDDDEAVGVSMHCTVTNHTDFSDLLGFRIDSNPLMLSNLEATKKEDIKPLITPELNKAIILLTQCSPENRNPQREIDSMIALLLEEQRTDCLPELEQLQARNSQSSSRTNKLLDLKIDELKETREVGVEQQMITPSLKLHHKDWQSIRTIWNFTSKYLEENGEFYSIENLTNVYMFGTLSEKQRTELTRQQKDLVIHSFFFVIRTFPLILKTMEELFADQFKDKELADNLNSYLLTCLYPIFINMYDIFISPRLNLKKGTCEFTIAETPISAEAKHSISFDKKCNTMSFSLHSKKGALNSENDIKEEKLAQLVEFDQKVKQMKSIQIVK